MENKISKILDSLLVRVAFDLSKTDLRHSYLDHIALEILRDDSSMAYRLLSLRLNEWEMRELPLRIEDLMRAQPKFESQPIDEFLHLLRHRLEQTYSSERHISTVHVLCEAVSDTTTATSQVLAHYGINLHTINSILRELGEGVEGAQSPLRISFTPIDNHTLPHSDNATPLLEKLATDLTTQARDDKLDAVIGRENEIDRMVQILSRRKKNNPILIGEAGVGKSAIVEGLAQRIASCDVPVSLQRKRIFSLDVASLVAGTKYRGEFEERMQQLLDELRSADDVIIFIDEIHTIVGAGATQGSLDTANILKPVLARSEVQIIGATTLDEFRENIEKDAALERRFQKIVIEPTTVTQTLEILCRIAPRYEQHHNVRYSDEALSACVALSERYITDRHLPDKAIDVMDEAGARAGANECDQAVRLTTQQLQATTRKRDEALAALAYDKIATIRLQEIALKARLEEQLSDRIRTLERQPYIVKTSDVERAVATMTGIPVERLSHCETERLRTLADHLHRRVVGQTAAVNSLSRALLRSRAGLKDTNRPIGVFLFVGPTGVGKTLLAKELSRWLFDEHRGLIRLDMSEYGERHNVARLIGSPPGYVGYGEGGQLTEAVRRQPYAVVLLDEIEKAHSDVFNIMLQIFDEGHLTDGAGRRVDFRNTVIILTSNVGSRTAAHSSSLGYQTLSNERTVEKSGAEIYRKALENHFAPEFLGRIDDIICFNHLSMEDVEQIVALELSEIFSRARILGYNVDITPEARRELATTGYNPDYGVRSLRRTLTKMVEEPLSMLIVDGQLRDGHNVIVEHSPHSGLTLRVA